MTEELIGGCAEDDEAIEELSVIAATSPQRLPPYLGFLHDRDVLWPG
ncbi:hypothetical protein AB0C01_07475 [Micromonospora sp. NPDC048905]